MDFEPILKQVQDTLIVMAAIQERQAKVQRIQAEELDALSGIGKTRAAAIIRGRPYAGIEELVSRHILPTSAYDAIKHKIFVGRE